MCPSHVPNWSQRRWRANCFPPSTFFASRRIFFPAVAENQPLQQIKNRMTSQIAFTEHAARLRDFIGRHSNDGGRVASEDEFNQLARSLFALQFDGVPDYRIFCDARDASPETISHWSEIPAIPTAGFKEFELTSLPAGQCLYIFHSSGTTEHRPAHHFHNAESLCLYEASLLPWFKRHLSASPEAGTARREGSARVTAHVPDLGSGTSGFGPAVFLSLTPPPSLAPHSSLVHMFAAIHRKFGAGESQFTGRTHPDGSWNLDFAESVACLRRAIDGGRPVTVMGTAFNFVQFLDGLEQAGVQLNLPAGSRVLETGGYKGRSRSLPKNELHSLISAKLGVPSIQIVSEYGMCELSSQAYDLAVQSPQSKAQGSPRSFHFPPWARAQVISPETGLEVAEGETGLIRVFDLANMRSVLAIQTEDLGIRRGEGFELIGRATLAESRGCSLMSL